MLAAVVGYGSKRDCRGL